MFAPLRIRGLEVVNRIVVSPMCQYSAVDGKPSDWHLAHLGSFARGGAGLVVAEMTDVSLEGRITRGCAGIWSDEHVAPWRRIVDFAHGVGAAKIGLQLGHAGPKASCRLPWEGGKPLPPGEAWEAIGPSPLPFDDGWPAPRGLGRTDMDRLLLAYEAATRRALAAGFDLVEIHMAHGYLLSAFLSPVTNRREDAYGGSLEGRMRFPLEVLDVVRAAWPDDRPVFVRISATDWLEDGEGQTPDDATAIARALADHGCDVVDVSSGGNTPRSRPVYGRMYQVPFADRIRHETGVPVMAVGAILGWDHANTILAAGRADLCALARPHLLDPHLTMRASVAYEYDGQAWPAPYLPARPVPKTDEDA
jgi:anthraniloyl-CoA monooxygenase